MRDYFNQYIEELLKSHGIDIRDRDYKKSENYKKIHDMGLVYGSDGAMSVEEYIERYLLSKDVLPLTYESIYDMGNNEKFIADYKDLAYEIIDKRNLADGKDGAEIEAISDDLVNGFIRSGGMIDRIKKYLNLDLDLFDKDNAMYQCEIIKIIYFFHMLEKKYFPEIRILELLSKPSMENIDNSFLGMTTSNGIYINMIKYSIEKELSQNEKDNIKSAVFIIVSEWEQFLKRLIAIADYLEENEYDYEFKKIIESLNSVSTKINEEENCDKYWHSPIETLYLKIVQHEYLGRIQDILMINDIDIIAEYKVPKEYIKEMKILKNKKIDLNNINIFFGSENIRRIAKYVYLKPKISKEERRKIKESKDEVVKFFDYLIQANPLINIKETVTELLVISCLQALILDKITRRLKPTHQGYEGKRGERKGEPYEQKMLKSNKRTYDTFQIYWVRKVNNRFYANLGLFGAREKIRELENICDNILINILKCPNIKEMLGMHSQYIMKLNDDIGDEYTKAAQKIERYLYDKGFTYLDKGYMIRYILSCTVDSAQTCDAIISMIESALKDKDLNLNITIESEFDNDDKLKEFDFNLVFDYENKTCTLQAVLIS